MAKSSLIMFGQAIFIGITLIYIVMIFTGILGNWESYIDNIYLLVQPIFLISLSIFFFKVSFLLNESTSTFLLKISGILLMISNIGLSISITFSVRIFSFIFSIILVTGFLFLSLYIVIITLNMEKMHSMHTIISGIITLIFTQLILCLFLNNPLNLGVVIDSSFVITLGLLGSLSFVMLSYTFKKAITIKDSLK